ncbi:MAG: hypothetical protein Q7U75_08275 [Desulfobacterales bacterium]|nr:hypothetical protein [Desulfobacterales bacterium]
MTRDAGRRDFMRSQASALRSAAAVFRRDRYRAHLGIAARLGQLAVAPLQLQAGLLPRREVVVVQGCQLGDLFAQDGIVLAQPLCFLPLTCGG